MGLFGVLGKVLGKVAQAGASALTHGASDKIIKVLKGRGVVKQVLAKGPETPATNNEVATVRKLLPAVRLANADAALNAVGAAAQQRGITGITGYSKRAGKGGRTGSKHLKLDKLALAAASAAPEAAPEAPRKAGKRTKGMKKDGTPRKPPTAAQLAQRARFAAMARARAGK